MYIRNDQAIPPEHSSVQTVTVVGLDLNTILNIENETIEVTSHGSSHREYAVINIRVTTKDGKSYNYHPALFELAMRGVGTFHCIEMNKVATCATPEEYRAIHGPWSSKWVPDRGAFLAQIEIDGEKVFPDCAVYCAECRACLGCVRKQIFDASTGLYDFEPYVTDPSESGYCGGPNNDEFEKKKHHKPAYDEDEIE